MLVLPLRVELLRSLINCIDAQIVLVICRDLLTWLAPVVGRACLLGAAPFGTPSAVVVGINSLAVVHLVTVVFVMLLTRRSCAVVMELDNSILFFLLDDCVGNIHFWQLNLFVFKNKHWNAPVLGLFIVL